MSHLHHYQVSVIWTGYNGKGTTDYRSYERSHVIRIPGKADILASSDPQFRGDAGRHNPEELFLSSLSACHMLWYLHLCSEAGVLVLEYTDQATGIMEETANGGGRFTEVILHPVVVIAESVMMNQAQALHRKARELCFIANSVNFPVRHDTLVQVGSNNPTEICTTS